MVVGVGASTPQRRAQRAEQAGQRLTGESAYNNRGQGLAAFQRRSMVQDDLDLLSQSGVGVDELTPEAFNVLEQRQRVGQAGSMRRPTLSDEQSEQFAERFREENVRQTGGTQRVRVFDALTEQTNQFQARDLLGEAVQRAEAQQSDTQAQTSDRRRGAAPSRRSLFNVLGRTQV